MKKLAFAILVVAAAWYLFSKSKKAPMVEQTEEVVEKSVPEMSKVLPTPTPAAQEEFVPRAIGNETQKPKVEVTAAPQVSSAPAEQGKDSMGPSGFFMTPEQLAREQERLDRRLNDFAKLINRPDFPAFYKSTTTETREAIGNLVRNQMSNQAPGQPAPMGPEILNGIQEIQTAQDQKMAEYLGPESYALYQEFQQGQQELKQRQMQRRMENLSK